jgi:hypothetical protein
VDGEEFTNRIPDNEGGFGANQRTHQMCLIHRDFKHFATPNAKQFRHLGKVSSIMSAKVLSIMRAEARRVTMG